MSFRIEVRATEWGGQVATSWTPAITGTLNQTGLPDVEASTFDSIRDARQVVIGLVVPEGPEAWRIVEVDGARIEMALPRSRAARTRKNYQITLSDAESDRLDELARRFGDKRSPTLGRLIMERALPPLPRRSR
jgi:hypothetical protein